MAKYTAPTATRRLVRTEREADDDSDLDLELENDNDSRRGRRYGVGVRADLERYLHEVYLGIVLYMPIFGRHYNTIMYVEDNSQIPKKDLSIRAWPPEAISYRVKCPGSAARRFVNEKLDEIT
jgi:hypothetical protein